MRDHGKREKGNLATISTVPGIERACFGVNRNSRPERMATGHAEKFRGTFTYRRRCGPGRQPGSNDHTHQSSFADPQDVHSAGR